MRDELVSQFGPIICQVCGKPHIEQGEPRDGPATQPQTIEPKPFKSLNYNETSGNNHNESNQKTHWQALKSSDQEQKSPFQQMLDQIRSLFDDPQNSVDIEQVKQVLASYKSNYKDWAKYAFYEPNKYKRNLVDEHEKYNVMILTWGRGAKSRIHDHSGSHCFMKVCTQGIFRS